MKAVVYQAPFSIAAENVPDPELQHPNDGIVKITSSCIGGADLHMYEGRTATLPSNASRPRSEPAKLIDANRQIWLTGDSAHRGQLELAAQLTDAFLHDAGVDDRHPHTPAVARLTVSRRS